MTTTRPLQVEHLLAEQSWLRSLARRLSRDSSAAADLEQETWLVALQNPPGDPSRARAWLRTVAYRLAQRCRRAESLRVDREQGASRREPLSSTAQAVGRAEGLKSLVEATLALEEPFRETVLLRYFEDLEPKEIAELMDVPASTVRSRLTRAHGKLRARWVTGDEESNQHAIGVLPGLLIRTLHFLASMKSLELRVASCAVLLVAGGLLMNPVAGSPEPTRAQGASSGRPSTLASSAPEAPGPDVALPLAERRVVAPARTTPAAQESIRGDVRAPNGSPVAGATILVRPSAGEAGAPDFAGGAEPAAMETLTTSFETHSASDGSFALPGRLFRETEHALVISARAEGFQEVLESLRGAGRIELRPEWVVRFEGRVVDAATGRSVVGAEVLFSHYGLRTITDEEGRFRYDDVPARLDQPLRLRHPEYTFVEHTVDLIGSQPFSREFEMSRGRELLLRFVDAETEQPVTGVTLFLDEEGDAAAHGDGSIRLRVDPVGPQRLLGEADGYSSFEWTFDSSELPPGGPLEIPLERLASVLGIVVDQEGALLPGCQVLALAAPARFPESIDDVPGELLRTDHWLVPGGREYSTTRTDPQGRFELRLLPSAGPRIVRAWSGVGLVEQPVDFPAAPLRLALERKARESSVTGRLMRGGQPWSASTELTLTGELPTGGASDSDGGFELDRLPAGAYRLTHAGRVLREFQLSTGRERLELGEVPLDGLPRVTVLCRAADGTPVSGVPVLWEPLGAPAGGAARIRGEIDGNGSFVALLPRAGDYRLLVGKLTALHDELLSVDADRTHTIVLPPTHTLHLRMIDGRTGERAPHNGLLEKVISWRRPGTSGYTLVRGEQRFDGVIELDVPSGPVELSIQAGLCGYQPRELGWSELAAATAESPRDVLLTPGVSLQLGLDAASMASLAAIGDRELYLLETGELDQIRTDLETRASWDHFLDQGLLSRRVHLGRSSRRVSLGGLAPGRYTLVVFEGREHRRDLLIEPEVFEVGAEGGAVELRIRS